MTEGLRPKQIRFAQAIAETDSLAQAARLAGYNPRSGHVYKIAANPRIRAITAHRRAELAAAAGVTREAVIRWLWAFLRRRKASDGAKIRAAELLLKHLGSRLAVDPAALAAAEEADASALDDADAAAIAKAVGVPLTIREVA